MTRGDREVVGFVVREEYWEDDPKKGGRIKRRRTVSRVFHSRDAAITMCAFLRRNFPSRDYYVHEKTGFDDADIR